MIGNRATAGSLRLDRPEISRLAWVFVFSLALHLLCLGTYEIGKKAGWWQAVHWPAWLQKIQQLTKKPLSPAKLVQQLQDPPLVFVNVNPLAATAEAPKNAKYYSSHNAQAANPDADQSTDVPKIAGLQDLIAKTDDTQRAPFDKLQPDFKALQQQREAEAVRVKPSQPLGDLTMAKPQIMEHPDTGEAEQPRPRTIKEALQRLHRDQLVGEKMKQAGGVNRRLEIGAFDTKATPFGAYDAALIEAVQSRWYDLLDQISFDGYRRGKVVVEFRLYYDGRVTEMKVLDNTVGQMLGLLCEKAVLDPAPYDKWPKDMRLEVDRDYRELHWTFFYN